MTAADAQRGHYERRNPNRCTACLNSHHDRCTGGPCGCLHPAEVDPDVLNEFIAQVDADLREAVVTQRGDEDPLLSAILNSLSDTYRPEGVGIWMNSSNRNFGGERPIDLVRRGEAERVLAEADRLAGGPLG